MCLVISVLLLILAGDSVSGYNGGKINDVSANTEPVTIIVGESMVIKAPWPTVRVAVTDPKIANVQILTPDQVLLQGTNVGSTDMILWSEDENKIWQSKVYVGLDVARHQQKLLELFPNSSLQLDQSGDVLIVKGLLRSAEQVVQLHDYLERVGLKYVDMTSVAGVQQVQLQVRVAEVSRTALRSLTMNALYASESFFGGLTTGTSSGTPLLSDITIGTGGFSTEFSSAVTIFAGRKNYALFFQALAENQYVRLLANPTLVALSGEEASFLAGGEFPIPVVQGSGGGTGGGTSITIDYREFGVRLRFRPIVLGDNTIRLYTSPEVSELTDVGAVTIEGFSVPALITRKAETTLELKSGQTFAMAGLIQHKDDATVSRIPGLGDLPILGTLFRSVRYRNNETELVVLVTASLVEPMSLVSVPPLPGLLHVVPNDWELYLEGRIEGKEPAKINETDTKWLRQMGLDKLLGPGAWDSYGNPIVPSRADLEQRPYEQSGMNEEMTEPAPATEMQGGSTQSGGE